MDDLREQIILAFGRVSLCWSHAPDGTFNHEQVQKIGEELLRTIKEHEQAAIEQAIAEYRASVAC